MVMNMFFSMREGIASSWDHELYKAIVSQNTIVRLTNNTVDDLNVSTNEDFSAIVWERPRSGKKTVYYRLYSSSTNYQTFYLASQYAQYEPTISWNGKYLALVRQWNPNRYSVMRYNLTSKGYKRVHTSSHILNDPTPTNNGKKVSWLQGKIVKIKNLATRKTIRIISSVTLKHPYLTWDGNWLTLVIGEQVSFIDLSKGTKGYITKLPTSIKHYAPYWALPSLGVLEIDVIGLLGTVHKATAKIHLSSHNFNKELTFHGPSTKTLYLPPGTYHLIPKDVEHHNIPDPKTIEIVKGKVTKRSPIYTLKPGQVLFGTDKDNPNNNFIQPIGETDKQHMEDTDILLADSPDTGDLLFGILGRDTLVGGAWDDVLVGGPENFVAPNSDAIRGNDGDDINIWVPGDGSDAFVGDDGKDVIIFGPFKNQAAPGDVPSLFNANGRKVPQVTMSEKPQFTCKIETVPANSDFGYEFLVRFAVNGDVKVTVRLKDVEFVICPSSNANSVAFADLSQGISFSNKTLSNFADTLLGEILQP